MGLDDLPPIDASADARDGNAGDRKTEENEQNQTRRPAHLTMRPVKRSFSIRGHRTSISLEGPFWEALREQAERDRVPVARIVAEIDGKKGDTNLSSAIRVWVLSRYRQSG